MLWLILRRIAVSVPLLIAVSFLTFSLVSLMPGDAAYTVLGSHATPEQLEQLREEMGLDQPLLAQYGAWLAGALRGDFGVSLISGQSVIQAIGQRVGPTVTLVLFATAAIVIVAIPLGILSAVRGGRLASLIDSLSFLGLAIPHFILALFLIPLFAIALRWFPPSGYVPPDVSVTGWLQSIALPVAAMAIGPIGIIAKQTRAASEDVMRSEFVTVLRANGYRRRSIVWKHILKAAAVPIIAYIGVSMVALYGATVLIETIFGVPGLGGLAVQASTQSDLPMVVGVTVVFTALVIILNIVLDVLYAVVNPKVSLA